MTNARSESVRKPGKLGCRLTFAAGTAAVAIGWSGSARAQQTAAPPPTSVEYAQYGVSLHTLTLLDGGEVCPNGAPTPCIVGSGGGLGLRLGYRSRGPFYVGAAFQLSRLNSSNLLRLAILQRLTAEGRYYFDRGNRLTPYLLGGLGGAIYGNEWGASSGGAALSFGVGFEYQITERTVVTLLPAYQPVLFRRFTDATGQVRAAGPLGFGLVHWLAVQVVIEVRDPLSRW
jgi:opacity protein-like surface antigen